MLEVETPTLLKEPKTSWFGRPLNRLREEAKREAERLKEELTEPQKCQGIFNQLVAARNAQEFLNIAATEAKTLENLIIVLNSQLDLSEGTNRQILYFALETMGSYFIHNQGYSNILRKLIFGKNAEVENNPEYPALKGFIAAISKIFSNQDFIKEFFANRKNINNILTSDVLIYVALQSEYAAQQILQIPELINILSQNPTIIVHLYKKFPANLLIANQALSLPYSAGINQMIDRGEIELGELQENATNLREVINTLLEIIGYLRQQQITLVKLSFFRQEKELEKTSEFEELEKECLSKLEELERKTGFKLESYTLNEEHKSKEQEEFDKFLEEKELELIQKKEELEEILFKLRDLRLIEYQSQNVKSNIVIKEYFVPGFEIIDEDHIKANIQTLIQLNGKYSRFLDEECLQSMFAHADTLAEFTQAFNYLYQFRRHDLLNQYNLFNGAANFETNGLIEYESLQEKALRNISHHLYKNTAEVFANTNLLQILHNEPEFTQKLYADGTRLSEILCARTTEVRGKNRFVILDAKKFLEKQGQWLTGEHLVRNFSVIKQRFPRENELYNILSFRFSTGWLSKKDSYLVQIKKRILEIAEQEEIKEQDKQDLINLLKDDKVRGWIDFSTDEVQKLVDTKVPEIEKIIAGDRSLVAKISKENEPIEPILKAGKQRAEGVARHKGIFDSTNTAIKNSVEEVKRSKKHHTQEFYLLMRGDFEKYLTINRGSWLNPRQDDEICQDIISLCKRSPIFALVLTQDNALLEIINRQKELQPALKTIITDEGTAFQSLLAMVLARPDYIAQFDSDAIRAEIVDHASLENLITLHSLFNEKGENWGKAFEKAFIQKINGNIEEILAFATWSTGKQDNQFQNSRARSAIKILTSDAKISEIILENQDQIPSSEDKTALLKLILDNPDILAKLGAEALFNAINRDIIAADNITDNVLRQLEPRHLFSLLEGEKLTSAHYEHISARQITDILKLKKVTYFFVQAESELFKKMDTNTLNEDSIKKLFDVKGNFLLENKELLNSIFNNKVKIIQSFLRSKTEINILQNNPELIECLLRDIGVELTKKDLKALLYNHLIPPDQFEKFYFLEENDCHNANLVAKLFNDEAVDAAFIAAHIELFKFYLELNQHDEPLPKAPTFNTVEEIKFKFIIDEQVVDALKEYFTEEMFLLLFRSNYCTLELINANADLFAQKLENVKKQLNIKDIQKVITLGNDKLGEKVSDKITKAFIIETYNSEKIEDSVLENLSKYVLPVTLFSEDVLCQLKLVGTAKLEKNKEEGFYNALRDKENFVIHILTLKAPIKNSEKFIEAFNIHLGKSKDFIKKLDFAKFKALIKLNENAIPEKAIENTSLLLILLQDIELLKDLNITNIDAFVKSVSAQLSGGKPEGFKAQLNDITKLKALIVLNDNKIPEGILKQPELVNALAIEAHEFSSEDKDYFIQELIRNNNQYMEVEALKSQLTKHISSNSDITILIGLFLNIDIRDEFRVLKQDLTRAKLVNSGEPTILAEFFSQPFVSSTDFSEGLVPELKKLMNVEESTELLLIKILENKIARTEIFSVKNHMKELVARLNSSSIDLTLAILKHQSVIVFNYLNVEEIQELFWNNETFRQWLIDSNFTDKLGYTQTDWLRLCAEEDKRVIIKSLNVSGSKDALEILKEPVKEKSEISKIKSVHSLEEVAYAYLRSAALDSRYEEQDRLVRLVKIIPETKFIENDEVIQYKGFRGIKAALLLAFDYESKESVRKAIAEEELTDASSQIISQNLLLTYVIKLYPDLLEEPGFLKVLISNQNIKMALQSHFFDKEKAYLKSFKILLSKNPVLAWELVDINHLEFIEAAVYLPWIYQSEPFNEALKQEDYLAKILSNKDVKQVMAARLLKNGTYVKDFEALLNENPVLAWALLDKNNIEFKQAALTNPKIYRSPEKLSANELFEIAKEQTLSEIDQDAAKKLKEDSSFEELLKAREDLTEKVESLILNKIKLEKNYEAIPNDLELPLASEDLTSPSGLVNSAQSPPKPPELPKNFSVSKQFSNSGSTHSSSITGFNRLDLKKAGSANKESIASDTEDTTLESLKVSSAPKQSADAHSAFLSSIHGFHRKNLKKTGLLENESTESASQLSTKASASNSDLMSQMLSKRQQMFDVKKEANTQVPKVTEKKSKQIEGNLLSETKLRVKQRKLEEIINLKEDYLFNSEIEFKKDNSEGGKVINVAAYLRKLIFEAAIYNRTEGHRESIVKAHTALNEFFDEIRKLVQSPKSDDWEFDAGFKNLCVKLFGVENPKNYLVKIHNTEGWSKSDVSSGIYGVNSPKQILTFDEKSGVDSFKQIFGALQIYLNNIKKAYGENGKAKTSQSSQAQDSNTVDLNEALRKAILTRGAALAEKIIENIENAEDYPYKNDCEKILSLSDWILLVQSLNLDSGFDSNFEPIEQAAKLAEDLANLRIGLERNDKEYDEEYELDDPQIKLGEVNKDNYADKIEKIKKHYIDEENQETVADIFEKLKEHAAQYFKKLEEEKYPAEGPKLKPQQKPVLEVEKGLKKGTEKDVPPKNQASVRIASNSTFHTTKSKPKYNGGYPFTESSKASIAEEAWGTMTKNIISNKRLDFAKELMRVMDNVELSDEFNHGSELKEPVVGFNKADFSKKLLEKYIENELQRTFAKNVLNRLIINEEKVGANAIICLSK